MENKTDINEVNRWVNHYKHLLGLQHWEVDVKLLSPSEVLEHLDESGLFQGRIVVSDTILQAHIQLVDPVQLSEEQKIKLGIGEDLRSTLLHEMIHILWESCNIPEEKIVEYEQAVVRLERGIRFLEKKVYGE